MTMRRFADVAKTGLQVAVQATGQQAADGRRRLQSVDGNLVLKDRCRGV
jgi:hypothetical protein